MKEREAELVTSRKVAEKIVAAYWEHVELSKLSTPERSTWLSASIEAAINSARADLARKMLSEVDRWRQAPSASRIYDRLEAVARDAGVEID